MPDQTDRKSYQIVMNGIQEDGVNLAKFVLEDLSLDADGVAGENN
jgi:hypothetical protein